MASYAKAGRDIALERQQTKIEVNLYNASLPFDVEHQQGKTGI